MLSHTSVPSGPVAVTHRAELSAAPPLPVRSCSLHEASPQLLCSVLRKPRDLSCSSHVLLSRPFPTLAALLWMLSNIDFYVFLMVAPKLFTELEM